MKRILILLFLLGGVSFANAQALTQICFRNTNGGCQEVTALNPFPVSGTITANLGGFNWQSSLTPLSVTTSSGTSGSFTAGKTLIVSNVGTTNTAYCKLGTTATTSSTPILPGQSVNFTSIAETTIACITSTSTTTVNVQVGSGLPTGWGGSGSGSGGSTANLTPVAPATATATSGTLLGGQYNSTQATFTDGQQGAVQMTSRGEVKQVIMDAAGNARGANVNASNQLAITGPVTVASGAVASGAYSSGSIASGAFSSGSIASGAIVDGANVVEGTTTDAASSAGGTGTLSAKLRLVTSQLSTISTNTGAALPAGTNIVGYTSNDPCAYATKLNKPFNQNGTSSAELVALSGSTTIYVCSISLIAAGATTWAMTTGTGTACATSNAAVIGSTTANIANSMSFASNGGITLGNGGSTIAKGAASSALCHINGTNVYVAGNITYVQQ